MRLAIHHTQGSFSEFWIKYCEENNIDFKLVNCFDTNIINQLDDCNGLMWHWDQNCYKAALFARELTTSLETKGVKVFPNNDTAWHHDDKLGQKYLLESIGAPVIKTYVFYSKEEALKWCKSSSFPKVFKLRGGAGSINVSLVHSQDEARKLVKKAFKKGFSHINRISRLKDRYWVFRRDRSISAMRGVITGILRLMIPTEVERFSHNHKGYIYFQDFIPNNISDIRLVIVGNKCYGVVRYCRKGDFRASGSGIKSYDPNLFDLNCIKIAFAIAKRLDLQSVAFDFIKHNDQYKVIEMSYCFVSTKFPGFWDENLLWHEVESCPQTDMVENFVLEIQSSSK